MRRTSVSLPKHNGHSGHHSSSSRHDPHEKRARYRSDDRHLSGWAGIAVRMSQALRTRWLKAVGILTFCLFLFYYFSPSGVELYHGGLSGYGTGGAGHHAGNQGQMPSDSSYGTDRCTRSSSKDKPIVQYVLMIDAGSTGSRIHVYKFNNCGPTPELEKEDFKMTEKHVGGLSAFKNDPVAAAKSLDPLLKVAMDVVPDKLKSCSPIAVKATAGLRLIGKEQADKILEAVREHLETNYPFPVVSREQNGVAIMDGSDEGVYAWITTNYLLGKIGGPDKSPTAAVFDLGGGSTQIVFQPTFPGASHGGMPERLAEGDHRYDLDFGGRKFELYQHSHLGYGLMAARKAIHAQLIKDLHEVRRPDRSWLSQPIVHPCLAPGQSRAVEVELGEDHELGSTVSVNLTGPRIAHTDAAAPAAQCRALAEKILKKDRHCELAPCSFNGVHQPSLSKTFAREDVYIFSYFYDRTKPLGMPESFTLRELHELAHNVCGGEARWEVFAGVAGALEELRDRPEYCLDLNFMMALLHTGYEMPIDREVKIAKKIKGNELGWCLGARYVPCGD